MYPQRRRWGPTRLDSIGVCCLAGYPCCKTGQPWPMRWQTMLQVRRVGMRPPPTWPCCWRPPSKRRQKGHLPLDLTMAGVFAASTTVCIVPGQPQFLVPQHDRPYAAPLHVARQMGALLLIKSSDPDCLPHMLLLYQRCNGGGLYHSKDSLIVPLFWENDDARVVRRSMTLCKCQEGGWQSEGSRCSCRSPSGRDFGAQPGSAISAAQVPDRPCQGAPASALPGFHLSAGSCT
jgi:hypothetical protein